MEAMLQPTIGKFQKGHTHGSVGWKSLRSMDGDSIPEGLRRLNDDSLLGISNPSGSFPLAFSLRGFVS